MRVKRWFNVVTLQQKKDNAMRSLTTIICTLLVCLLTACSSTEAVLTEGHKTSQKNLWEPAEVATVDEKTYSDFIDFGVYLGSFHVQEAHPAQELRSVCVLLNMKYGAYDEADGDFDMRYFSLAPDKETLLPYINILKNDYPSIRFCAVANQSPEWLDPSHHKEELFKQAYVLYLSKFIDEYKKQDVTITDLLLPKYTDWGNVAEDSLKKAMEDRGITFFHNLTDGALEMKEELHNTDSIQNDIWETLCLAMNTERSHNGIILKREDSLRIFQWKQAYLQHMQSLMGETYHFLKAKEGDSPYVLAYQLEKEKLLLMWNPFDHPYCLQLFTDSGQTNLQLEPRTLYSYKLK